MFHLPAEIKFKLYCGFTLWVMIYWPWHKQISHFSLLLPSFYAFFLVFSQCGIVNIAQKTLLVVQKKLQTMVYTDLHHFLEEAKWFFFTFVFNCRFRFVFLSHDISWRVKALADFYWKIGWGYFFVLIRLLMVFMTSSV